jgi:hypothetical protein
MTGRELRWATLYLGFLEKGGWFLRGSIPKEVGRSNKFFKPALEVRELVLIHSVHQK